MVRWRLSHLHHFAPLQPFRVVEKAGVQVGSQALAEELEVLANEHQFLAPIAPAAVKVGPDLLANAVTECERESGRRRCLEMKEAGRTRRVAAIRIPASRPTNAALLPP